MPTELNILLMNLNETKPVLKNSSGIAGIFHSEDAAADMYYLLHSIQHRGSDGAGIAAANGKTVTAKKSLGMLQENFKPADLENMAGCTSAIGQVRMANKDDVGLENLQPIMVRAHQGHFAIAVSGSVKNAAILRERMEEEGLIFQGTSDAEVIAHLIQKNQGHLFEKISKACSELLGSFCFLLMTKNTMYALRSDYGVHHLFMGQTKEGAYVFSSETASFSLLDAKLERELHPGELIRLGKDGLACFDLSDGKNEFPCSMECVYFSKADSLAGSKSVYSIRKEWGRLLAENEEIEADIVVGVPDTAQSAAAGFAQALNKPYEIGLIKNRYIGSTFVQPTKEQRKEGMRVRLNAASSVVKGKKVYLVDDSMTKGFTAKRICQLLKEAGALEVHLRIAAPKQKYSCIYGQMDVLQQDLAAHVYSEEEMIRKYNLDSIRFLDIDNFKKALCEKGCFACFEGKYPDMQMMKGK